MIRLHAVRSIGLAGLMAAAATGCGHSPPTRILILDAVPVSAPAAYAGPAVAIPAVHVPPELDRTEFVQEIAPGQMKVEDFDRWAAPLGLLVRDALIRDLTARLPAGKVLPPGAVPRPGTVRLGVTILSVAVSDGQTVMQVSVWRIGGSGTPQLIELRTPTPDRDPATVAGSVSGLLGQLADAVAARLRDGALA